MKWFMMVISIIIIGLFLFRGQHPTTSIENKVKTIEDEFMTLVAAIYSFYYQYNSLPGDINGNGKIEGTFDSAKRNEESRLLWLFLRQEHLIAGHIHDQRQPQNIFGGLTGIASGIVTGKNSGIEGLFIGFSKIPRDVVARLDKRGDDGYPNSGMLQAQRWDSGHVVNVQDYSQEGLYNLYAAF